MDSDRFYAITIERRRAAIPLHSDIGRQYAVIDVEDADAASQLAWFRHRRTGYPTYLRSDGSLLTLHSFLLGRSPKGLVIDHANGNKLDNRRENLRLLTTSANGLNRHRSNKNNRSSGTPGVSWSKQESKWRVQIRRHGKDHFGGYFADHAKAVDAAAHLRRQLSILD